MTAATFDRFQISRNELPHVFKRDIANVSTNGNFGSKTSHKLDTANVISENVPGIKVGLHLPAIKVGKKMGSLKPDILSLEKERKRLGFVSRKKGPGFYERLDEVCEASSKPDTAEINRSIIDGKSIFVNNGASSEDGVIKDKSRGRPNMKHPTLVYGEITRPWTPVFALLEHKYIDKKDRVCINHLPNDKNSDWTKVKDAVDDNF